jgi:hypothetical protein
MTWRKKLMTIEELWVSLRGSAVSAQRRIDTTHPLDLYADFEPPDHPGLVLFCPTRPPDFPSLSAIRIERLQRSDGKWSLRIFLEEPELIAVFRELCRDIIDFTRSGVEPSQSGSIVLSRIERWRSLMQADSRLDESALRGLIGELLLLETLFPALGLDDAVAAWTGPLGTPQDFRLPCGRKIEVKALDRDGGHVLINGLGQLDAGGDPLRLAVVRLEDTGKHAPGGLTAPVLVGRLRARLAGASSALQLFNNLLRFAGWDDADEYGEVVVRMVRIEEHEVDASFPRLTAELVPAGVVDATYKLVLPPVVITQ